MNTCSKEYKASLGTATVEFKNNDNCVTVVYHQTPIFTEGHDHIILNTGGYHTLTTVKKMNQALKRNGYDSYSVKTIKGNLTVLRHNEPYVVFNGNVAVLERVYG